MFDALEDIRRFLETGGPVLWVIGLAGALLAALIIERYWFFRRDFPRQAEREVAGWLARSERGSWHALRIREAIIADASIGLKRTLPLIRTLVALCPLLGLLGTVTGMMAVFDVIAVLGTGNARAMASGISRATIPTMAGMMVALAGFYFRIGLQRQAERQVEQLADRLAII